MNSDRHPPEALAQVVTFLKGARDELAKACGTIASLSKFLEDLPSEDQERPELTSLRNSLKSELGSNSISGAIQALGKYRSPVKEIYDASARLSIRENTTLKLDWQTLARAWDDDTIDVTRRVSMKESIKKYPLPDAPIYKDLEACMGEIDPNFDTAKRAIDDLKECLESSRVHFATDFYILEKSEIFNLKKLQVEKRVNSALGISENTEELTTYVERIKGHLPSRNTCTLDNFDALISDLDAFTRLRE